MIVIADTSPINYLVLIEQSEVLPKLCGRIVIPPSVCEELQRARTPEVVRQWVANPPSWLEIVAPKQTPDSDLIKADLDAGERDAILLAQELAANELIIDDRMDAAKPSGAGCISSERWVCCEHRLPPGCWILTRPSLNCAARTSILIRSCSIR